MQITSIICKCIEKLFFRKIWKLNILRRSFLLVSILVYCTNGFTSDQSRLVSAALKRTETSIQYDPSYFRIQYPGGDIPVDRGVCTDVVIRCYRAIGIDLQKLVHEDMKQNFHKYPNLWGMTKTDTNIDHRRVPNLRVFFKRKGISLAITNRPEDYKPGDIVTWNLNPNGSLPHIGIVVDRYAGSQKIPMIVHNIGQGPQCENILFTYKITGHYRYM